MDPVSGADRVAALLRQRLLERARKNAEARSDPEYATRVGIDTIHAAHPIETEGEGRRRRRTLIENILVQELGAPSINDPQFQQLIDRVLEMIEGNETASAVLGQAMNRLSDSP